jgi:hypothetical protein
MNRYAKISITAISALTLLSACLSRPAPTLVPGMEQTLAVRTIVALQGVSYFATSTPSPTPTTLVFQVEPASIYIPPATFTPVPSLTPFSSNPGLVNDSGPCRNRAEFMSDVTYQDLSQLKPNEKFTKVWQLRNSGECSWTPDYSVVFTYGDRMQGETPKPLGVSVAPGETVNISVDLVAPKESNYYQGNWMLQDNYGSTFSCGGGTRDYFWVAIVVGGKNPGMSIFGNCGGGG